jgi:hypothetical protein
VIAF